jgi:hypothetical protein
MAPFSVTVHHGPFLLLVASGSAALSDLRGVVDLAAQLSRNPGYTRVLADLISIEVLFPDEDFRALQLYAAQTLHPLEKLAFTVPACYIRGKGSPPRQPGMAHLRAFTQLQEACEWMAK